MYIISKFSDYYDSACAFGIDKTIMYKRKMLTGAITYITVPYHHGNGGRAYELPEQLMNKYNDMYLSRHRNYSINPFIIGFCGKYYPGYRMKYENNISRVCWNTPDIISFFLRYKLEDEYKSFVKRRSSKEISNGRYWRHGNMWAQDIETTWSDPIPNDDSEFHKYKSPIILYQHSREPGNNNFERTLNPELKVFDFARKQDPFTAFQELQMYISGVLGCNENEMVQISDEDMRDAKGHDNMSFKKYPTKRR